MSQTVPSLCWALLHMDVWLWYRVYRPPLCFWQGHLEPSFTLLIGTWAVWCKKTGWPIEWDENLNGGTGIHKRSSTTEGRSLKGKNRSTTGTAPWARRPKWPERQRACSMPKRVHHQLQCSKCLESKFNNCGINTDRVGNDAMYSTLQLTLSWYTSNLFVSLKKETGWQRWQGDFWD